MTEADAATGEQQACLLYVHMIVVAAKITASFGVSLFSCRVPSRRP